jgi:uncharacterized RDD family membrane protein YckC
MNTQNLEYVGFWARFGASIIDGIIIMVITFPPLIGIYGWTYFDPDTPFLAGPADFAISWVFPAVATLLFWSYKQATPGKMAISARIVDARTGHPASFGQLLTRYLTYFISMIPLFLGFIWAAFDPRKQSWHDKIAGTVVIRPSVRRPEPVRFDRA